MGDSIGEATARMNVSDLRKVLGMPDLPSDDESIDNNDVTSQSQKNASAAQGNNTTRDSSSRQIRVRRQSMEQLDLIKVFLSFLYFVFSSFGLLSIGFFDFVDFVYFVYLCYFVHCVFIKNVLTHTRIQT